jgi:hypothetical protein
MQSAKSIVLKKRIRVLKFVFSFIFLSTSMVLFAQNNSPYSRFGLGDLSSGTNITTRGMGGISAAYSDIFSVNFANPASYSQFQAILEQRSKKLSSGRVVLDVGTNLESRTLIAPNTANRFTSNDLLFSYVQVGLPLRKNWGLSFGIRPISRISYLINREETLKDPVSGNDIERAVTQFRGTGGSYLPSIGTGFAIKNLSLGINAGYLFGNRENTTLRSLINDSLLYYSSEHTTNTSFGSLFFDAGLLYTATLKKGSNSETVLRFGVSGNWKQTLDGSQNIMRQTFTRGSSGEELRIDSVYENNGVKGEIMYPSSYKAGFTLQRRNSNGSGWLFGVDYGQSKWSEYRYFGQADSVQDSRMFHFGGQFNPRPQSNYFSNVAYRFGFFTGKDYIKVRNDLPVFGMSFGAALPIRPSRMAPNQFSMVNLALEYIKRGNNDNLLKENMFRFSLGLNLTDLWFGKRKYE